MICATSTVFVNKIRIITECAIKEVDDTGRLFAMGGDFGDFLCRWDKGDIKGVA